MKMKAIALGSQSGAVKEEYLGKVYYLNKRVTEIKIYEKNTQDCYCYIALEDGSFYPCAYPGILMEIR